MSYSQLVSDLVQKHIGYEHFNPGLENLKKALDYFELNDFEAKVITIAGTNGKGETTRAIGHLLKGNHTYLQWTSPHISCITERFVTNGLQIDSKVLHELVVEYLESYQSSKLSLSYYEFLFIIFMALNNRLKPQFLLLEVGLGGRLDAVNAIDADIAVLTSISRDHQEFLGKRYDQIILEKLGVTREDRVLFSSLELKYLRNLTKSYCHNKSIKWIDLFENNTQVKELNYSLRNQLLATKVYEYIFNCKVSESMWQGYRTSTVLTWSKNGVHFYGLGSHNPDGLRKLVQFLSQQTYNKVDTLIFSFSRRSTQDLECMFKIVDSMCIASKKLVSFNHPKAMNKDVLKNMAMAYSRVEFVDDEQDIFQELKPGSNVVVCGSYYFLGEFKSKCST